MPAQAPAARPAPTPAVAAGHVEPVGSRLEVVDGLRALAATAVLGDHVVQASQTQSPTGLLQLVLPNLGSGVTLFFVISGFLLFRPWAAALLDGSRWPSVRRFGRNRALRIVPAYWGILTIVLAVMYLGHNPPPVGGVQLSVYYLLLQGYFVRTINTVIAPAWSLAVEVLYYASLPLIGLVLWRCRGLERRWRLRALLLAVGLLFLAGMLFNLALLYAWRIPVEQFRWYNTFPARVHLFAGGMALAVLHVAWRGKAPPRARPWLFAGAGLGLLVTLFVWRYTLVSHLLYATGAGLETIAYALMAAPLVVGAGGWVTRVLASRPVVYVGMVSYSFYLLHQPLIMAVQARHWWDFGGQSMGVTFLLFFAVVLALASISYLALERPFLLRRRTWAQ
ncbi:MAG: acyltransferase family protein [Candidatus Dormibacteria bacterium]